MSVSLKCPVCDRIFHEEDPGAAMPFCSFRCKTVDVARWLDESYGLPVEIDEETAMARETESRDGKERP